MSISAQTKADPKLKAELMKSAQPEQPPPPPPIQMADESDFAAWAVMKPKPAKTFGKVLDKWRRSKTQANNVNGYWAAYTQEEWAGWMECSTASFKRYVEELVMIGLVEKLQRHHGNRTLMFYRPTPLALQITRAKDADWTHLGVTPQAVVKKSISGKWTQLVEAYYPDQPKKKLSPKQLVQLKQFETTCPPDTAKEVLTAVVKDWSHFTGTVQAQAGWFTVPALPDIGFVAKFVGVAVSVAYPGPYKPWEAAKKFPVLAIAPKAEPKPEPVGKPVKEPKATWDEIEEILSDHGENTI